MDEISRKVLGTIHQMLQRLTSSENLTPEQLTEVFMAATALGYQMARMDYPAEALAQSQSAEVALAGSAVSGRPRLASPDWTLLPGAALCAAIEAGQIGDDPKTLRHIRDLLVAYHLPMDPMINVGTRATYDGGRGDGHGEGEKALVGELEPIKLEAWLRAHCHISPDGNVASLKRLMGGYSKATYIANITDGTTNNAVVIRKDSPGLPTGSSVTAEFPILEAMADIGIPAPKPLWIEPDATLFNGAFMGVSLLSGIPANRIVPTERGAQRRWAQSTAELLARLHTLTAQPEVDIRDSLAIEIDGLEARMLERERSPHPGLLLGLRWLRGNFDRLDGRPACRIHGDFGFHNMLMENDHINALLDWEFSRIGDPVEDLASIKPFMDQIESWDAFNHTYQANGGFAMDRRAEDYFAVWQETRNMVACIGSLNSLLLPGMMEMPLAVAGTIYIPKYEIAIFDAIATAENWNG